MKQCLIYTAFLYTVCHWICHYLTCVVCACVSHVVAESIGMLVGEELKDPIQSHSDLNRDNEGVT